MSITSGVWPDPVTSIEPVYWGVGNDLFAFLVTYHQHGEQKHPTAAWVKELIEHPTEVLSFDDAAQLGRADRRSCSARRRPTRRSSSTGTTVGCGAGTPARRPSVHIPVVEKFVDRMAAKMGGHEGALPFEVINRTASAHFTGGIPIGDSSETRRGRPLPARVRPAGAARHRRKRDAGQHRSEPVAHRSPRWPSVRMSLWPNKGDVDTRPPLGSGYQRVDPVMPHRPVVPAGAPGELRLDAKKADVIPDYPY